MAKKLDNPEITAVILDLLERGATVPQIAGECKVSQPTMAEKIAELQKEQGVILQYRAIQSLQLSALQFKVLNAITPEKIEEAPLRDLINAFKVLKANEHLIEGKPTEIKGLVAYLQAIEKEEIHANAPVQVDGRVIEVNEYDEERLPKL